MNNVGECPLCGKEKRRHKDLICPECFEVYTSNAGTALAAGKIVSLVEWAKEKGATRLGPLQEALQAKGKEYKKLQQEVSDEAYRNIMNSLNGRIVPKSVLSKALETKRKEFWTAKGGHKLHRELKMLENQITFLVGFLSPNDSEPSSSPAPEPVPNTNLDSKPDNHPDIVHSDTETETDTGPDDETETETKTDTVSDDETETKTDTVPVSESKP